MLKFEKIIPLSKHITQATKIPASISRKNKPMNGIREGLNELNCATSHLLAKVTTGDRFLPTIKK